MLFCLFIFYFCSYVYLHYFEQPFSFFFFLVLLFGFIITIIIINKMISLHHSIILYYTTLLFYIILDRFVSYHYCIITTTVVTILFKLFSIFCYLYFHLLKCVWSSVRFAITCHICHNHYYYYYYHIFLARALEPECKVNINSFITFFNENFIWRHVLNFSLLI